MSTSSGVRLRFSGDLTVRSFKLTRSPGARPAADAVVAERSREHHAGPGPELRVADQQHRVRVERGHVKDGVADGPTVRIVWNGTIDGGRDDVTLDGTLVPSFHGLNTVASKVPL